MANFYVFDKEGNQLFSHTGIGNTFEGIVHYGGDLFIVTESRGTTVYIKIWRLVGKTFYSEQTISTAAGSVRNYQGITWDGQNMWVTGAKSTFPASSDIQRKDLNGNTQVSTSRPGTMRGVNLDQHDLDIVDQAHSPDALENWNREALNQGTSNLTGDDHRGVCGDHKQLWILRNGDATQDMEIRDRSGVLLKTVSIGVKGNGITTDGHNIYVVN